MGQNGWINRRLFYVKECQKNLEKHARGGDIVRPITDQLAKLELDSLKSMVIEHSDHQEVMNKLNETRHYRKQLMKIKETDVRHMFPFFMSKPDLVCCC